MGIFDGNGHTISHLTIRGGAYLGLFGQLGEFDWNPPLGEVMDLSVLDVNITGSDYDIGGLAGYNAYGHVTGCCSTGTVTGEAGVGGLVGSNSGTVIKCYNTGTVSGTYDVGGLVGSNYGDVTRCWSTGSVSGDYAVGGLIGHGSGLAITDCYSTSAVNGTEEIGGLVGDRWTQGLPEIMARCYSTGAVDGLANVGGLVGAGDVGNVACSFWDTQTSGQATSIGGTGKTTVEMQTASTFLEAGWDSVNVWGIGENQTYPYLRKYSAADINQDASVNFLDLAALAESWLTGMAP